MLLKINPINPQPKLVSKVVAALKKGGVVGYPTDTTYGIGCSIFSKEGIERIYEIKQRDRRKPVSFICHDLPELLLYGKVNPNVADLLASLLPGPYTFVLEPNTAVPDFLLANQLTVGIRIPDSDICLAIVKELGAPIITTSANVSGENPIGDPSQVERELGDLLDVVVDGGELTADVSSVVSLIGDRPEVLRKGVGDVSWCER